MINEFGLRPTDRLTGRRFLVDEGGKRKKKKDGSGPVTVSDTLFVAKKENKNEKKNLMKGGNSHVFLLKKGGAVFRVFLGGCGF